MPSFARPEEAARYRKAVVDGNVRALQRIDQALEEARKKRDIDVEYVRKLESMRAQRSAVLQGYRDTTR
jgi:hypothetical protein